MRGTGLILLLFLLIGVFHYSRWALPEKEELPAVVRLQPQLTTVMVDDNGNYSLHQLNDGSTLKDVIKMTKGGSGGVFHLKSSNENPIITGEYLEVSNFKGEFYVHRSWLSARHRILLEIPLHPDRMILRDWEALPGIGPGLAQAIESDRQKNGDFGEISALDRVRGIGLRKLEVLKGYFKK